MNMSCHFHPDGSTNDKELISDNLVHKSTEAIDVSNTTEYNETRAGKTTSSCSATKGIRSDSRYSVVETSAIFVITLLFRLILVFRFIPSDLDMILHSENLASVLRLPFYTSHSIKEAIAIRNWVVPHRFADSYARLPGEVKVPPLVLVFIEPFVRWTTATSSYWEHVAWGLLLLGFDLLIAERLEQIANLVYDNEHPWNTWECRLESLFPERIQPTLSQLFYPHCRNRETNTDNKSNEGKYSQSGLPLLAVLRSHEWPAAISLLYFASPVSILTSSCFGCFQNVRVWFLLSAIYEASRGFRQQGGSAVWTATLLSLAVLMDPPLCFCLIPVVNMFPTRLKKAISLMAFFLVSALLWGLAYPLVGARLFWDVCLQSMSREFRLEGVPPSLSIFWYTKMEFFVRFAEYFQLILMGLPFTIVIPVAIRLQRYPVVMIATYWMIWTIFRPASTLYELNVGLCLMALSPMSVARMNDLVYIVAFCALLIPVNLFVLLHWMWLEAGNGEANFLFFQALAYNIFLVVLVLQFVDASVARDKALLLTEKMKSEDAVVSKIQNN